MIVVKVGGSLFDRPDLGPALLRWLEPHPNYLLVPGGGAAADAVRRWDTVHALGEVASHRLALRSLSLTAGLLNHLVPTSRIVAHPLDGPGVLDSFAFLEDYAGLPHSWAVTSDSIAAHTAIVGRATKLVLLKSVDIPDADRWATAAADGRVDAYFPTIAAELLCPVEVVNFRAFAAKFSEEG